MPVQQRSAVKPGLSIVFGLLVILLLGAGLRFYGLTSESLWNDELSSWRRSHYNDLTTVLRQGVLSEIHPPGYHILLFYVEKVFGDSELALRFPSALSGVLSVAAIYRLGKRLYSAKEGLIAAALMAVLWCPIYYSQEARVYGLLILFSTLTMYFWFSLLWDLEKNLFPSKASVAGYVFTAVILSYLHYFGLYLVLWQALWLGALFVRRPRSLIYIAGIYLLIGLAYLPWMPWFLQQLRQNAGTVGWISTPKITALPRFLRFLFNESWVLLALVGAIGLMLVVKRAHEVQRTSLYETWRSILISPGMVLVWWLVMPFGVVYLKSIVSAPLLTNRNLLISLAAAYVLAARAIAQLPINTKAQVNVTLTLLAFFALDLTVFQAYYTEPQKQQFRDAVSYVIKNDPYYSGSLIIGYAWSEDYFNYYFEKLGSAQHISVMGGQATDIAIAEPSIRQNYQYVWYIFAKPPDEAFTGYLNNKLMLIDQKKFIGVQVWLFQRK